MKKILWMICFITCCSISYSSEYFYVWRCIYCSQRSTLKNPYSKPQKCDALENGFHIWKLRAIKTVEEDNNA